MYLDDRPVFEEERRRTNAWGKVLEEGGTNDEALEAERTELKLIRKEKDEAEERFYYYNHHYNNVYCYYLININQKMYYYRNFKAFEQLMREGQEIRRLRELENQQTDKNQTEAVNAFSGEAIGIIITITMII